MKVFLCFSSADRYSIVNSVLYHLKRFHIPVWYDYHELTLGDNRMTGNFELGLDLCNYAVVIISPSMFQCKCGNDELDEIKKTFLMLYFEILLLTANTYNEYIKEQYSNGKW